MIFPSNVNNLRNMLKPEVEDRGFKYLSRDLMNVND